MFRIELLSYQMGIYKILLMIWYCFRILKTKKNPKQLNGPKHLSASSKMIFNETETQLVVLGKEYSGNLFSVIKNIAGKGA